MNLRNVFNQEPVVIVNTVRMVCLAGIAFGLNLTPVQLVASMGALEAVLTLFTRANVHSQASVDAQLGSVAVANGNGRGVGIGLILVMLLGGGVLVSSACAPATWKNPQTVQVFNRDGLVKSMAALQHTAILLGESTPPRIPLRDTKIVVDAVQTFLDAVDAAGEGAWGTAAAILDSLTQGQPGGRHPGETATGNRRRAPAVD
jgi:hypothetical protein